MAEVQQMIDMLTVLLNRVAEEDSRMSEGYQIKHLNLREGNLKFYIYSDDHQPPHFHVRSPEWRKDAKFQISDCAILGGEISHSEYKIIKKFHQRYQSKIQEVCDAVMLNK